MKIHRSILAFVFILLLLSCDYKDENAITSHAIIGSWKSETVYLNKVNSKAYVDWLNNGTFFGINNDHTFSRNYVDGSWSESSKTLRLERGGFRINWNYTIISLTKTRLTLEIKLTEGQYCCDFDAFASDELITITEVYRRLNQDGTFAQ